MIENILREKRNIEDWKYTEAITILLNSVKEINEKLDQDDVDQIEEQLYRVSGI